VTYGASTHEDMSETVDPMSDQQTHGVALFLVGVAALSSSAGVAWALSRSSRTRWVVHPWFITFVSFALFVVGVALCWFGVSALVEGQ
jgi:hypothetical protein